MNYTVNAYTNNERLSFRFMTISVFLGLISQCFQTFIGVSVPLYFSILIFGYVGIILYFLKGRKRSIYTTSFSLLIIYFCVVGLLRGRLSNFTIAVVQDLRYVMYFLMGAIFALSDRNMSYYHSIMRAIGYVTIVLGIYAIITFPFGSIEGRESTWSLHYYFWWASSCCFAYLGAYALVTRKDRIVGLGAFAVYFVLGMLFLKRSAFVNVIVIVFLSLLMQSSKPLKNILVTISGVIIFLLLLQKVAPEYFIITEDALIDRFDSIDSVENVDRNVESQLFFYKASISDILLGYGIFNYPDIIISGQAKNALHSGWANIIFKGGVFYAIWYIYLYARIFRNLRVIKKTNALFHVCIVVALSSLISLVYEGSWTYTILPFCISAPIFFSAKKLI